MRLLVIAVCCYAAVLIMFATLQRSLMYPAMTSAEPLSAAQFQLSGIAFRDVEATTEDGLTLHGWYAQPEQTAGEPRPLVLFFHGNGGNRYHRIDDIDLLTGLGLDVLIFYYRGYAEKAGSPSESGLAIDARAAWDFATTELHVSPQNIILFGESLGGGVAVTLAAEKCKAGSPPGGVFLRGTLRSLVVAASFHYPWVPIRLALLDRYDSLSRIGAVTCPILMMHGDNDHVVPFSLGEKLFDAAPAESATGVEKRLVVLKGASHNDVLDMATGTMRSAIGNFLRDTASTR
jgi:fermentation-respiration switch protein FrsA (DUF1100 family)